MKNKNIILGFLIITEFNKKAYIIPNLMLNSKLTLNCKFCILHLRLKYMIK